MGHAIKCFCKIKINCVCSAFKHLSFRESVRSCMNGNRDHLSLTGSVIKETMARFKKNFFNVTFKMGTTDASFQSGGIYPVT